MAEMYAVKKEDLEAIGDAIRLKRDITTPIEIKDMPLQIGLIDGGGSVDITNAPTVGNVVDNMYLSHTVETPYPEWSISPYYDISTSPNMILSTHQVINPHYCAFYDSNFNAIGISTTGVIVADAFSLLKKVDGAHYFRLSVRSSQLSLLRIKNISALVNIL